MTRLQHYQTRTSYGSASISDLENLPPEIRDPPIMLIILPIMLCCTAQNFSYYAQISAQYLPIMLKLCSIFMPQFPCFSSKLALHRKTVSD